jgi:hypothetical protein
MEAELNQARMVVQQKERDSVPATNGAPGSILFW